MHRFKELVAWKIAIEVVKNIYKMTENYPDYERFGLTNQIRRAAVSIPSNIAEGAGKNSDVDFIRYLAIAMGSCNELETQLIISHDLGYVEREELRVIENKLERVQNMLFKLQAKLRNT